MKKIITLIVALLAFAMGTQSVHAQPTKDLIGPIRTGMVFDPEGTSYAYFVTNLLTEHFNQLRVEYDIDTWEKIYISNKSNKMLFTVDSEDKVTVLSNVTEADDIVYTITDEDRNQLKTSAPEIYNLLSQFKTVQLRFNMSLEATLTSGMNLDDEENYDALMAFSALRLLQYLITSYDDATRTFTIMSPAYKVLFTMTTDGYVAVASGLTSADDITYTITEADRELFKEEGIEEEFAPYETIKLHFGEGTIDPNMKTWFGGTLRTGFKEEDDEETYMAFYFLWQVFHQLKVDYNTNEEEETNEMVISNLDGKVLFTIDDNGIYILAPNVTPADDIVYTITAEDRNTLMALDMDAYHLLFPCSTVELHFDISLQAITFDFSEVTMYPGQQLQLEPHFIPVSTEDRTLRYENISINYSVSIDDNGLITAMSEGVAFIEAFGRNSVSGEEIMATWGPEQSIYLKIIVAAPGPGEEIFFDYKEGDGPVITYHVTDLTGKLCEVGGRYDEDDCTTLAVPENTTGVVSIPEEAMGNKVIRVGANALYELEGITELHLPSTIEQIGAYACARCYNLKHVYIPVSEPLKFTDAYGDLKDESMGHNDAFDRVGEDVEGATLHVVEGSLSAWNVYPWNEWFRRIVDDVPDSISLIPALS